MSSQMRHFPITSFTADCSKTEHCFIMCLMLMPLFSRKTNAEESAEAEALVPSISLDKYSN